MTLLMLTLSPYYGPEVRVNFALYMYYSDTEYLLLQAYIGILLPRPNFGDKYCNTYLMSAEIKELKKKCAYILIGILYTKYIYDYNCDVI